MEHPTLWPIPLYEAFNGILEFPINCPSGFLLILFRFPLAFLCISIKILVVEGATFRHLLDFPSEVYKRNVLF